MKTFTHSLRALAAAALLSLAAAAHASPLTFTLEAPFQTTSSFSGGVLTFYANLLNADPVATLFFNADNVNLQGAGLSVDDSGFWINSPLSLDAGAASGMFALFSVTVDAGTAAGLYAGSFDILGGGLSDFNVIGHVNFDVNVVPEPPGLLLLGTGILLGLLARVRGRRRR